MNNKDIIITDLHLASALGVFSSAILRCCGSIGALTAPLPLYLRFSNSPLTISASCRNSSGFLNIKIQDNNNNKNLWDYTAVLQTTNLNMLISETRILFLSIRERRFPPFSLFILTSSCSLAMGNSRGPPGRGRSGARAAPLTRPCPVAPRPRSCFPRSCGIVPIFKP